MSSKMWPLGLVAFLALATGRGVGAPPPDLDAVLASAREAGKRGAHGQARRHLDTAVELYEGEIARTSLGDASRFGELLAGYSGVTRSLYEFHRRSAHHRETRRVVDRTLRTLERELARGYVHPGEVFGKLLSSYTNLVSGMDQGRRTRGRKQTAHNDYGGRLMATLEGLMGQAGDPGRVNLRRVLAAYGKHSRDLVVEYERWGRRRELIEHLGRVHAALAPVLGERHPGVLGVARKLVRHGGSGALTGT